MKICSAIINLFHLIPAAPQTLVKPLLEVVMKTERAMLIEVRQKCITVLNNWMGSLKYFRYGNTAIFWQFSKTVPGYIYVKEMLSCMYSTSGWKSIQRAVDQVPYTTPISDSGTVYDGGYTKRPSMEPHVHGKTLPSHYSFTHFLL